MCYCIIDWLPLTSSKGFKKVGMNMCLHIHIDMHICIYMYIYAHMQVNVNLHIHLQKYEPLHMHMDAHIHKCKFIYFCKWVCTRIWKHASRLYPHCLSILPIHLPRNAMKIGCLTFAVHAINFHLYKNQTSSHS